MSGSFPISNPRMLPRGSFASAARAHAAARSGEEVTRLRSRISRAGECWISARVRRSQRGIRRNAHSGSRRGPGIPERAIGRVAADPQDQRCPAHPQERQHALEGPGVALEQGQAPVLDREPEVRSAIGCRSPPTVTVAAPSGDGSTAGRRRRRLVAIPRGRPVPMRACPRERPVGAGEPSKSASVTGTRIRHSEAAASKTSFVRRLTGLRLGGRGQARQRRRRFPNRS